MYQSVILFLCDIMILFYYYLQDPHIIIIDDLWFLCELMLFLYLDKELFTDKNITYYKPKK